MTGRDLILYILENHLEDAPVYENDRFVGFMTDEEAAEKFGVGVSTILVWISQGLLEGIRIVDDIYVPWNAINPMDLVNKSKGDRKEKFYE